MSGNEENDVKTTFPKGVIFLIVISSIYVLYKVFLNSISGWVEITVTAAFCLFIILALTRFRIFRIAAPVLFGIIFLVQSPNILIVNYTFSNPPLSANIELNAMESFIITPEEALKEIFPKFDIDTMKKTSSVNLNMLLLIYLPIIWYLCDSGKIKSRYSRSFKNSNENEEYA